MKSLESINSQTMDFSAYVYIVTEYWGTYDAKIQQIVGVFNTEEKAKQYIKDNRYIVRNITKESLLSLEDFNLWQIVPKEIYYFWEYNKYNDEESFNRIQYPFRGYEEQDFLDQEILEDFYLYKNWYRIEYEKYELK